MAKTPKKAAGGKTPKAQKEPKTAAKAAPATETKIFNAPAVDEDNQKLFHHHLKTVKDLRGRLKTLNSDLRNAYKKAKGEGAFTKDDFDTAIEIENAEQEAKVKARIARKLVIARYMGKALGAQLELFMEPDRTPASDIAYEEGRQAALQNVQGGAKPPYDPSTEQFRRFMEGFHSVSEERVTNGIKPLHPEVDADQQAKAEKDAKIAEQRAEDEKSFEAPTSGVPMSRAQFIAQQQAKEQQEGSAFSRKN